MVTQNGDMVKQIQISETIVNYIKENKRDYRLCTSCGGPVILPVSIKKPKPNDIKLRIGEYVLYVSATQAPYIDVIDDSMLMTLY